MPLGMEVGLGPGHIVLDGNPAVPQDGHSPQFSAHVCCQTAGSIKMSLGTKVGVDLGDIVLDGDPAPPKKRAGGKAPGGASQCSSHVYCDQTVAHRSYC